MSVSGEVLQKLHDKKCPACGFRIMSAPNPGAGENSCMSYNHIAWKSNLQDEVERCWQNPFEKLTPTIAQNEDGTWQVIVGISGLLTEADARRFWTFARKTDDRHLVAGAILLQQAHGYGGTWPKENI